MPKQISITAYTFAELSDKAKDKAHYDFLSSGVDTFDTDNTLEHWQAKLEKAGFNVARLDYSVGGQGDYVSIVGRYRYRKGWKKGYTAEYGNQCKALPCLLDLQKAQSKVFYDFDLQLSVTSYGTQLFEYDCIGDVYNYRYQPMPEDVYQDMQEAVKDVCWLILQGLRTDYEYTSSIEYFVDMCECNEWLFNEHGELL